MPETTAMNEFAAVRHPAKARLALRIGVVGTRADISQVDGLADRIREVLRLISDRVRHLHQESPEGYDSDAPPRLILVCGLAAGVDQLAAEIALADGYELHVLLAYPRDRYARENFFTESDRLRFEQLISSSTSSIELDENPKDDAYDTAGTLLVNHSDVLLAVWDFGPGKGPGGSADSVRKAENAGIPIVKLRSDVPSEALLEFDSRVTSAVELKTVLRDLLMAGLLPPHSIRTEREIGHINFSAERRALRSYYREREHRLDLSLPYGIAIWILSGRWHFSILLPRYKDSADEHWKKTEDATWDDLAGRHFKAFDMWADSLAVFYSRWMRGAVATTVGLGALVVDYTLASQFWPARSLGALPIVAASLTLLSAFGVGIARWRSVHRRWLQYRMLSENLRTAGLAFAIGGLSRRHLHFYARDTTPGWIGFYLRSAVRNLGLSRARFDLSFLEDFRQLLWNRVSAQAEYHRRRAENSARLGRTIRRCGITVFGLSFLGTILQILQLQLPHLFGNMAWQNLVHHVGCVALLLTIVGAALAAFAAQENFAKLAQVSSMVAPRLDEVRLELETVPLESAALREITGRAINLMMQEHEDWYLLYSLRGIEFTP